MQFMATDSRVGGVNRKVSWRNNPSQRETRLHFESDPFPAVFIHLPTARGTGRGGSVGWDGKASHLPPSHHAVPRVVWRRLGKIQFRMCDGKDNFTSTKAETRKLKTRDPKWKVSFAVFFFVGRDPLRNIPEQSPVVKRKTKHNLNRNAEEQPILGGETSDHLHKSLTGLNVRQPDQSISVTSSKAKAVSWDDEILISDESHKRPGLETRPLSDDVGLADFVKQREELKGKTREESLSSLKENPVIDAENSKMAASPKRTKLVVIASYLAEESGEVSLEEGEEFEVLQKESNGWWYVKNDFSEGWAPSAFLALARSRSPSPETPNQQQVSDNQEESCQIKENLETCPKEQSVDQIKFTPQGREKVPSIFIAWVEPLPDTKCEAVVQRYSRWSIWGITWQALIFFPASR